MTMAYYPDLTPYTYLKIASSDEVLNIGWLDIQHPFPKKKAPEALLDVLFERCLHPAIQMRGFHRCTFCDAPNESMRVSRHGRENLLGSSEIRITGKDRRVYAAPTLIYHYVAAHDYDPPIEFVEALMAR